MNNSRPIPFAKEELDNAYKNGITVDMSKVNFPKCKTLDENYNFAITYLRNTNFEITYDWSRMLYEQKVALLKAYLDTTIKYDIPALDKTWVAILFACCGVRIESLDSILNELELITIISAEFSYIEKIWDFVASLPLFAISQAEDKLPNGEVATTDEEFNLTNFLYVMQVPEFDGLYEFANQIEPKFYTKIFVNENIELISAISKLTFMALLHGMLNTSREEFEQFLSNIAEVYEGKHNQDRT